VGENTVVVTVTAQNGATADYVLSVTRLSETTTETTTEETTMEETSTEETSTEETESVPTVTVLGTVVSPERTFDILELPAGTDIPDGFSATTITIDGSDYTVYTNSDGMVIFYGRPSSDDDTDFTGVGWYSYDTSDGSVQAVPSGLLESTTTAAARTTAAAESESSDKVVDYRWKGLACVFGLAALLLLILLIVMVVRRRSGPHDGGDDFDGDDFGGSDLDDDLPDDDASDENMPQDTGDETSDLDDDILADDDGGDYNAQNSSMQSTPHMTLEPDEKSLADGVNQIMAEEDGLETLDIDETNDGK
jgi:hypothetical protein